MTQSASVSCVAARNSAVEVREHPNGVLPSVRRLHFVCPLCHSELAVSETSYHCEDCGKTFNVHAGIPDFRVFPDPYLDLREDRDRTEIVLAGLEKYDLKGLLDHYWKYSDITPENLRSKFVQSALRGEERARLAVETLKSKVARPSGGTRILEIGSGTGNFLAAAIGECDVIVGTDIAMRWLHVSRRRFMDMGISPPPLVCCCAEHLPFADGAFDVLAATSTLEFVSDQRKVLSEAFRVLSAEGTVYLNTLNRYSLAMDPYSHLWGVGFVPRRWQSKYVYWRNRSIYKARLLSFNELKRSTRSLFGSPEIALPDISPDILRQFSRFRQMQIRIYRSLKNIRPFSSVLRYFGPGWEVLLKKGRL